MIETDHRQRSMMRHWNLTPNARQAGHSIVRELQIGIHWTILEVACCADGVHLGQLLLTCWPYRVRSGAAAFRSTSVCRKCNFSGLSSWTACKAQAQPSHSAQSSCIIICIRSCCTVFSKKLPPLMHKLHGLQVVTLLPLPFEEIV